VIVIGVVKAVLGSEKQASDDKQDAEHGKNQFRFHRKFLPIYLFDKCLASSTMAFFFIVPRMATERLQRQLAREEMPRCFYHERARLGNFFRKIRSI
jgi:hypothetical protein